MNATRNEDQLGELEFLLLVDAIEEALVAIQQCGDSERALIQSEGLLRLLLQVEEALPEQHRNELIEALIEVVAALTDECTEQAIPQPQQQRQRGRPRASISEDQLVYLLEHSFSQVSIARMLGCSSRTIHRRIEELGLDGLTRYTNIDDSALDRMIAEVVKHFPNWGVKSIQGHLVSRQLRVQRSRVRESLRRVDAEGVEARCRRSLHRRVYSVPHPNSLWHIDGYHKLIRYHIVIHGGIDGFSRTIVYLKASDNNRAETVYEAFQNATRCFGIPSRVRSDYGGENVKVARFMIEQRGTGRGSMITGRSVHNQRIERLWRDLFTGCISIYYYLFRSMEEDGLLDCDDSTALYALHYIFLPRINRHLQLFTESWNNHPLRTQRNQTPMQLWISGILGAPHELYVIQELLETFGVDWEGPVPTDGDNTVNLNPLENPLSDQEVIALRSTLNPLSDSDLFGIDLYLAVVEFLSQL